MAYDIIFVGSECDPSSDGNYQRLVGRFPHAKRIDIRDHETGFESKETYLAAIKKSSTFNLYIVNSNVRIDEDFELDYVVLDYDKKYEHKFSTINVHDNEVTYGVRILHKSMAKLLSTDNSTVQHIQKKTMWRAGSVRTAYDVFFLRTGGLHADRNYYGMFEHAPWVQSITSMDQIAGLVKSRMFYLVHSDITVHSTFEFNYNVPSYDTRYDHYFYVRMPDGKEVAGLTLCQNPNYKNHHSGEKYINQVAGIVRDDIDVVFISYDEPNAEANLYQLRKKVPWAKHVKGVEGIKAAHRKAAEVALTDTFYVVDGDSWVLDEFTFDYTPPTWDRQYVHIYMSRNPVTEDYYGYGGIKIFHKSMFTNLDNSMPIDFSTTTGNGVKYIDKIGCATCFDSDAFHAWRGAYREVSKLLHQTDDDSVLRLRRWRNFDHYNDRPHNDAVRSGVHEALADHNMCDLGRVNDYEWLALRYKDVVNDLV